MGDLEWMLSVIMISGFLFAAIARFNLHRYLQHKKTLTFTDKQQAYKQFENTSPEAILDDGLHQLFKYFIAGMVIFICGSATLVDNGALEALMIVFVE
ncbi:hypothetical protein [Moritella sp. F3]|uniref:hypothetical protein n=1 Tax=Moritella sp. F3 TaxID=2718882 RepID=UPI0018E12EB8|nr:hypothetical protein [Moritella sp. F3]GIC79192.1 hypothetical protein FMO001_39190 [Moritella sp. F1]GIC83458.1 hypothetical protein FMO003_37380 [Moritella sp. F3]